jgi:hypothetical protein
MVCTDANKTEFTYCMKDWCQFKNTTEINIQPQSFTLSVVENGKFYAVINCKVPYIVDSNKTYEGTLIVEGCDNSKDLCDIRYIPMRAVVTEKVYFTQFSENILNTPMIVSVSGECEEENPLCYNLDGEPLALMGLSWTGFRLYHILFTGALLLFAITLSAAIESKQYPMLWGGFLMGEIVSMMYILYIVLL